MTTTSNISIKTSDLGALVWNDEGTIARWTWSYDRSMFRIVDTTPERHGYQATPLAKAAWFRARIVWDEDQTYDAYTVTTCGDQKGGTRHRSFDNLSDAVANVLTWIDRRFRAEVA